MYQHVPSAATRSCERLPPPGRAAVHAGQLTMAPAIAWALAQASPRPGRARLSVQRLIRDGEGKVVLGKLAIALALAGAA